jgi:hypothetical protein
MRRELAFLADILNEADIVLKHSAGVEEERFCADEVLSRAAMNGSDGAEGDVVGCAARRGWGAGWSGDDEAARVAGSDRGCDRR